MSNVTFEIDPGMDAAPASENMEESVSARRRRVRCRLLLTAGSAAALV
ncbi:hypothetical protein WMF37_11845 [Sorangium sp. So ce291]